jgi:hypothetical protein
VAEATVMSERTSRRILKKQEHEEQGTSFGTLGKTQNAPKRIIEIDSFDKCVVRRTSHRFFAKEGNVQLLKYLSNSKGALILKEGLQASEESLRTSVSGRRRPAPTDGSPLKGAICDQCAHRT